MKYDQYSASSNIGSFSLLRTFLQRRNPTLLYLFFLKTSHILKSVEKTRLRSLFFNYDQTYALVQGQNGLVGKPSAYKQTSCLATQQVYPLLISHMEHQFKNENSQLNSSFCFQSKRQSPSHSAYICDTSVKSDFFASESILIVVK